MSGIYSAKELRDGNDAICKNKSSTLTNGIIGKRDMQGSRFFSLISVSVLYTQEPGTWNPEREINFNF